MKKLILLAAFATVLGACAKNDGGTPTGHIAGANICSNAAPATCVAISSCNQAVLCSDVNCNTGCEIDGVTCKLLGARQRSLTCGACTVYQIGNWSFSSECF